MSVHEPKAEEARGPRLVGKVADGADGDFPLTGRTTFGRHPANTFRLNDREVSKEHIAIEERDGGFWLLDLGSSNGTFVNNRRIREIKLNDRDEIAIGNSRFVFRRGYVASAGEQSGVTVVGAAQSIPSFLAHLDQSKANEFRPADQVTDPGALRQDYEKLRLAHEFHREVGGERNLQTLLEKTLGIAFRLLAADTGVIFLGENESSLSPAAVKHRRSGSSEAVISETVLRRVVQSRQALLTADAIVDSRFSSSESIVTQGIRSAMAVPLLASGALKGVLFLDSREKTNAFSEKDLKILSSIASQAAFALENAELARKIEREAVTRAELSRFLSPAVADLVVRGEVELLRAGKLAEVTVLFADIRGFTTMAERESPQDTVSMLNGFFSAMAKVVFAHEGNLDKFIGDCVMAVWGPPSPHPDDATRALRAALEMQEAVSALNELRASEGKPPLEVGIGVNTGQAVVGYMGSHERHEFTAIGDSVNTAARLCDLASAGEVIATAETLERVGGSFAAEALPMAQVKGKHKGVAIFKVVRKSG